MMAQIGAFWAGRSTREQWLLGVMCALFALVVAIFGAVLPLSDALSAARERLFTATTASGQVETRIAALDRAKRGATPQTGAALVATISATAADAGFTLDRASAQGIDRVAITIPAAKSTALFAWLAGLNARGIFAETITVRRNGDASLAVDAVLRARMP
jgi:general secretion pathway protein M